MTDWTQEARIVYEDMEQSGINDNHACRTIIATALAAAYERGEQSGREKLGPIGYILPDVVASAEKAMRKFPQPNYVISKWAEETGEVTKALIHMAEGRETPENVRGEIVQSLAMLHRLLVEGDQVHGLPALSSLFTQRNQP